MRIMRLRRPLASSEVGVLVVCVLLTFFSIAQVFHTPRSNSGGTPTSVSLSKSEETKNPSGMAMPNLDAGMLGQREALKRPPPGTTDDRALAKVRARHKAQQEIRELERSLVKLMRANSRTPDQSNAELRTEMYARRIGRIIQEAAAGETPPQMLLNSLLNSSSFATSAGPANLVLRDSAAQRIPAFSPPFPSQGTAGGSPLSLSSQGQQTYFKNSDIERHHRAHVLNQLRSKQDISHINVPSQNNTQPLGLSSQDPLSHDRSNHVLSHSSTNQLTPLAAKFKLSKEAENGNFIPSNGMEHYQSGVPQQLAQIPPEKRPMCPIEPPYLVGNTTDVNLTMPLDIDDITSEHADVLEGGEWAPKDCVSRHRVAFVVPYRDRWSHLKSLLYYLIPVLKRQQIHFRIFVVEQYGNDTFNKGRIMNAAFREALKLFDFQCVTFHDVDLVPEDDRNMYSCAEMPKHMSIAIDKFDYQLPYDGLVGGVLMFKTENFQQVNGYSNMYWGWGAEDDDMTTRILHQGLRIYRPPINIARYKMIKHNGRKSSEVSVRMKLLRSAAKRSKMEGLNNIQYNLLYTHKVKLFTHFLVDIGHP